jgi:hypothetical protein
MLRRLAIFLVLPLLYSAAMAAPVQEARSSSMQNASATLRTELAAHGERIIGKEMMYRWRTQLERLEDCHAEFSVHVTAKISDSTEKIETVQFLLASVDDNGIEMQKDHWLQIPCRGPVECVFSSATCTSRSGNGVVMDCGSSSTRRLGYFSLQMDGDAESAQRMQQALRQAVQACRQTSQVSF